MRVRVCYNSHLPTLSLRDRENLRTILAGTVLPSVQVRVLCKNWHLCGLCWEDCEHKNSHIPTSPDVVATLTRLLKKAWGG